MGGWAGWAGLTRRVSSTTLPGRGRATTTAATLSAVSAGREGIAGRTYGDGVALGVEVVQRLQRVALRPRWHKPTAHPPKLHHARAGPRDDGEGQASVAHRWCRPGGFMQGSGDVLDAPGLYTRQAVEVGGGDRALEMRRQRAADTTSRLGLCAILLGVGMRGNTSSVGPYTTEEDALERKTIWR